MTTLPSRSAATAEERKIREYLLEPAHPENGGKATLFAAFVAAETETFGVKCHMQTPDGRNPCLTTIWLTSKGAPPRLVTAYR